MELIVLINLAFSVVGFFFIVRMWKEVKERRDYYGEHFAIPTGNGAFDREEYHQQMPVMQSQQQPEQMSMEQLTAAVVAAMNQQNQQQGAVSSDGDLQRLIANAAAMNGGGA